MTTSTIQPVAFVGVLCSLVVTAGCRDAPVAFALRDVELVEALSVGLLEGDEHEVFGRIVDVRAAEEGGFFVLDQQSATLSWFGPDGAYRGGLRRRGSGPGELAEPVGFDVSSAGTAVVLDPPNGRYSFFDLSSGDFVYSRSTRDLPVSQGSICSVGNRFFVRSAHHGQLIHEFDQEGRILRSFQPAQPISEGDFGSAAPMVASQLNAGQLRCLGDQAVLISMDTYLPNVRAFTLDGELVWETKLTDIRSMQFTPRPEGGVRFQADPEQGAHIGESVVPWTEHSLLVQYSVTWPEGTPVATRDRDFHAIESREISIASGEEIDRTMDLRLLVDERAGLFYSFEQLPYPRAVVLRRK